MAKRCTGPAFTRIIFKSNRPITICSKIGLTIDTTKINTNRLRQLARLGSKYEPYAFRRFNEVKRYSMLVSFLLEITQDLIDYAIEIHDRLMMNLQTKGKKNKTKYSKQMGKN
ncbi:hypothetical protein LQK80_37150 [Bacillus thuringiensis]|nr:hypothetical protein [Bacillus thuringiensis]